MDYKYKYTSKAKADLDSIFNYIALELSNEVAAKNLMIEIEKGIKQICSFPELCPIVSNIYVRSIGLRKKLIKNFVIYYLPDEKTRTNIIIRFVYSKRDMKEILRNIN